MIIFHLVDYVYIETFAGSGPLGLKLPHSLIIIIIIYVSYSVHHSALRLTSELTLLHFQIPVKVQCMMEPFD